MGPPPISEDWTPDVPRLDPWDVRIGPPGYEDWTPEVQGHKTQHPPEEDQGVRGIEDFTESRTSWDSGLHGIQDFAGPRTSWDSRLRGT